MLRLKKNYLLLPPIWYVYPLWHKVSFTFVGKYHVEQLRRWFRVYEIDELAFYGRDIFTKPLVFLHPYFFIATKHPQMLFSMMEKFRALIGVDVADTDQLGKIAVQLANMTDGMIVPSTWCKEVYINSGVKVPVHVVPHGLSKIYYEPRKLPRDVYLRKLLEEKHKHKYIYVLFFLIHSSERKGVNDVYTVMKEIVKTYPNVKLVMKTGLMNTYHVERVRDLGGFIFSKFLDDHDLVALYDMCDIYLLFSRGGGFEMNGLEALSRGEVVLAGSKGSWTEYLPDFLLISKVHRVRFFPKTSPLYSIHCGYGYRVDIDEAVTKLKDVIENLDDYKARVREYWEKVKHRWSWDYVGEILKQVVEQYITK